MNKSIRIGTNVKVAFTSVANRMATISGSAKQQAATMTNTLLDQTQGRPIRNYPPGNTFTLSIKALLRPIAAAIYRASKPLLRPIASRIRTYLLTSLRMVFQEYISAPLAELKVVQNSLRNQSDALRAQINDQGGVLRAQTDLLETIQNSLHDQSDALRAQINDQGGVLRAQTHLLETIQNSLRDQSDALVGKINYQDGALGAQTNLLERIEQYALASARRVAIHCGPGEILVRTEVGYILCSPSDHAVLACLLDSGDLERGTRYLLQNFLKPNNVFIDIGANLGMHTLAAARAMHGQGRIIAFEPFEPTQRLLTKSIWMNGFSEMTEIHQSAVSNRSGHQSLFLGASSGHHSLFQLTAASSLASQPVNVPIVRLDDVVPNSTLVDLIKIDVEGAELNVLESAKSLIASNPSIALIVEFGFAHLARTGHTTKDWLTAFHDLGLVYRAINADTGQLEEWTAAQLEAVDSINLFFARPKSIAWAKAGVAP